MVPRVGVLVAVSVAMISIACGLILDTVTRGRLEVRRLAYLGWQPSTASRPEG